MDTTSPSMSVMNDGTGIRRKLRRWKEKWRPNSASNSAANSRTSSPRAPLSRPSSNASSMKPAHRAAEPACLSLPPIPASPSPPSVPTALFTPTTETYIHSPADPRNKSRNTSASTSPAGTLRKQPPLQRRNTASPEPFHNPHFYDDRNLPMNVVTTTIVAGNDYTKRKRTSRLRLSISKRGSILSSAPSSPVLNGFFERSSSRATGRFDPVPEAEAQKRVDSDRETLVEEVELVKRNRPKRLGRDDDKEGTVELAYQYIGSRDGKKD